MLRARPAELRWSSEDQATLVKWRRGVCIFYGFAALTMFAAWEVHHLANPQSKDATAVMASSTALPPNARSGVPLNVPNIR
jgi:hypothetical protein